MRILVMSARRTESGAIAVLSAVLAVVLVGMAAFTLDFGASYASKRQLQTAADAAALAAADFYAQQPGKCASFQNEPATPAPTLRSKAQAIADTIAKQNRPGAHIDAISVECNGNNQLAVGVTASGSTAVGLGRLLNGDDKITTERQAEATVSVPTSVSKGLRPYMICSLNMPSTFPGTTYQTITFPGKNDACPTAKNPGNWWSTDCPNDGNNGTLDENTLNGCKSEVSIVPNQPPTVASPNTTLTNYLKSKCPTASASYCLGANPGKINGDPVRDAWNSLLGKQIFLPVFCGESLCAPAAVTDGGGNNAVYPVYKFTGVKVCGWSFASKNSGKYNVHFPMATAASDPCYGADASSVNDSLLVVFQQVQVSGSTKTSTCGLGDPCDGDLRMVLLTK